MFAVKGRERLIILSVYAQMLFMGPTYNVATNLEEWERAPNHIQERSKRASKRVKVPNLAQAAKSKL